MYVDIYPQELLHQPNKNKSNLTFFFCYTHICFKIKKTKITDYCVVYTHIVN